MMGLLQQYVGKVDLKQIAQEFYPRLPSDDGTVHWLHFVNTAWMAVVLLIVRIVADHTLLPALTTRMAKHGKGHKARAVFDNAYIVVWSIGTEILAIYVTLKLNGGCTPWHTDTCLYGWPRHSVHVLQKWYMILMFQFYLHEMLGAAIGQQKIKPDMFVHHVATMGLISTAYSLNLNRFGIMWQALFDTSNPLLHAAKGLHAAQLPALEGLKWLLFNSFALCFFVCRVAAAPYSILYPALTRSLSVLPREWAFFLMALMMIVCGMQWVWFSRIVMLALGKSKEEDEDGDASKKKK